MIMMIIDSCGTWCTVIINNESTRYMVSTDGRVFDTKNMKLMKLYSDPKGYLRVNIKYNNKSINKSVHRLVATAFIENPNNKPQVNHIDGNKKNNNVSNLEWCTCKENIRHGWINNLYKPRQGSKAPASKYSEEQIHTVCKLLENSHYPLNKIAKIAGVSKYTVRDIVHRGVWSCISKNYNIYNHFNK